MDDKLLENYKTKLNLIKFNNDVKIKSDVNYVIVNLKIMILYLI